MTDDLSWMTDRRPEDEYETDAQLPEPRILTTRERKRKVVRATRREYLGDFLLALPAPGETIHFVSNGHFDYWDFVPVMLDLIGRPVDDLCVSTWVMSRENSLELLELYDTGRIKHFSVLTGDFTKRRDPAVINNLIAEMRKRELRYMASKNHTKIFLFNADPDYYVIEGSANLTANPRIEQNVITRDRELYDFHRDWMEYFFKHGALKR